MTEADPVWITLDDQHLDFCKKLALRRQGNADTLDLDGANNAPNEYAEALALHEAGTPGECACYLYFLPVKWNTMRLSEPDFEGWIEARSISNHDHRLIVKFKDKPHCAYVLADCTELPHVRLVGFCWGHEAKQEQYRDNPLGNRPAFWVPQNDPIIKPMRELLAELRRRQNDPTCVRAGVEMTKSEWMSLPTDVRQAYWQDTDWGKRVASPQMIAAVLECLNLMFNSLSSQTQARLLSLRAPS